MRAPHQRSTHILVLDVTAKLGLVENPHPDYEKVWPLRYTETPAHHRYTEVEIVNCSQRFTIRVVATL